MEIDHDRRVVYMETLALAGQDRELLLAAAQPSEEQVLSRLTAPVVTTQLDTKNISFERNKTGILGWRSEKTEMVNGYEAKVSSGSWSSGTLSIHFPQQRQPSMEERHETNSLPREGHLQSPRDIHIQGSARTCCMGAGNPHPLPCVLLTTGRRSFSPTLQMCTEPSP